MDFCFVLCSLIRNFAAKLHTLYNTLTKQWKETIRFLS